LSQLSHKETTLHLEIPHLTGHHSTRPGSLNVTFHFEQETAQAGNINFT